MDLGLKGRKALVTGASKGLGFGCAQALAAEGADVFMVSRDQDRIAEAAGRVGARAHRHYTAASGIIEVRQAVARFVSNRLGVPADASQVVLVPGSKNVLLFTLLACVERGDEVILPDPGYPVYASLVNFIGAVPVGIRLREERDFRMDLDELADLVTPRTRMIIVNTPQNPTGGVLTREDVEFVSRLALEHDLLVISDEIYSQLVYGFTHVSPYAQPGMAERTVLMDGMSKAYAMTGWRMGYAVAPVELAAKMDTLMINSSSCVAAFTQMAAIEAFESADSELSVERMRREFERRRDLLVDGLNAIPGFRCARPQGAFYVFPNIEGTGMGERELARGLLEEAGVAVLPGTAFGEGGRGFLRLAYTNSAENIESALEKIANFVSRTAQ